ncbi:hypothetical protein QZH41_005275 [Actinostola sp. cb2023]|nr:hypothetical protein QZH41_005275 [Actinostola sp. cb2023]
MNPVEGRYLAMQTMLPDWDSFDIAETANTRKGCDVLETINQIWSRIMSVEIPDVGLQSMWHNDLLEGLQKRILKMDDMQKIEFYSRYNFGPLHNVVLDCFKDAAFDAIKRVTEVSLILGRDWADR